MAQENARKALYLAATANQEPSEEALGQMVHALCDSLLRVNTPPIKVFGPVEFAFCLFMRQKDGRYRLINQLTPFFAGIQWCLRMILAHVIRLHHNNSPSYIPCPPSVALAASATLSAAPHLSTVEDAPDAAGIIGRDQLEEGSRSVEEVACGDELEAGPDCLSDLEDFGDETPFESSGDAKEGVDQGATGSEPDGPVPVADKILSQESEGLLKWVYLIGLFS
jgi:hypothetical protein